MIEERSSRERGWLGGCDEMWLRQKLMNCGSGEYGRSVCRELLWLEKYSTTVN